MVRVRFRANLAESILCLVSIDGVFFCSSRRCCSSVSCCLMVLSRLRLDLAASWISFPHMVALWAAQFMAETSLKIDFPEKMPVISEYKMGSFSMEAFKRHGDGEGFIHILESDILTGMWSDQGTIRIFVDIIYGNNAVEVNIWPIRE